DSDLLVNLERTTLASTENKKSIDYDHKDRLEGDFTANGVEETAEMESLAVQVPVPKNSLNQEGDLNCDENETNAHLESSSSNQKQLSEEQQKQLGEFLTLLRIFLKQARHDDLRSVIDDDSSLSLIERMKKAIVIAKEREAAMLHLKSSMSPSEAAELDKKETASLMSDREREEMYEEIKRAIKEGIMHDNSASSTTTETPVESITETNTVPERTTVASEETTTVASVEHTTREGRVRIRIRTLAEVLEEERIEKEQLEKEAERIRTAQEKISGAVKEEVEKEKESIMIPLRPLDDQEEIDENKIAFAHPSNLRFSGVKTFVTGEEKKMIPVKDIDSISVLQSRELARKQKSDELRYKLEESLARRAAMREAVRARNEHLRRRIEEE
ncbi:hypothetical protein PFISCL1PPCAC_16204, partial [Pristionchus fissidentatus]